MKGEITRLLNSFFSKNGLTEENFVGRIKIRSIRIQVSLQGINLASCSGESMDLSEDISKVKEILQKLNLTGRAA